MTRTLEKRSGQPGSAGNGRLPEPAGFLSAYPGYRGTALLDRLRATEYSYLDAAGHVYLDYAGAGLPAQAQLAAHAERLRGGVFGNPHSENPASAASTELVERARRAVLAHFNAPPGVRRHLHPERHRRVPAGRGDLPVRPADPTGPDAGQSQLGQRHPGVRRLARRGHPVRAVQLARAAGGRRRDPPGTGPAPAGPAGRGLAGGALRRGALGRPGMARPAAAAAGRGGGQGRGRPVATLSAAAVPRRRGLLAYPAQSNFSGVQHPLRWIQTAHEHGYDVLLDAAAYVPSNRLDLSVVKPDFVPVSWYKVLGYPTGVGCLIARREVLGWLWRPWFAGGSVHIASVQGDWHALAPDEARFEDGTVSFLQIPDLEAGLAWVNGIGIDRIHQRVMCLTGWLLDRLAALRHDNGEPMARIYGPAGTRDRGGTVAFNLLDPGGRVVDERAVARAAAAGISIRTGCFCNPGATEGAFQLTKADWRRAQRGPARTMDQYVGLLGLPSAGALRASVGLPSNVDDVERFLAFLEMAYRDRVIGTGGLAPRRGC